MKIRERMELFFSKEKSDAIPYTIYNYEADRLLDNPVMQKMLSNGLGVTYFVPSTWDNCPVVEYKEDYYTENNNNIRRVTMHTDKGDLYCTYENGWNKKFYLETKEDYQLMTYIIKNTQPMQNYKYFNDFAKNLPEYTIPLVAMGRSPMQVINVDFVGLENFAYHLYDFEDELLELYDALYQKYKITAELIAEGPGRYVSVLDNFTAETIGPDRYKSFLVPVYEDVFKQIKESGKVIGTHYDGKLFSCKEHIKTAPQDIIESLTEPPEGDMTLDVCRKSWPDKLFWSNFNVGRYNLPEDELRQSVYEYVLRGTNDGTKFAVEVSEHLPKNWEVSMPIVLDTLNNIKF